MRWQELGWTVLGALAGCLSLCGISAAEPMRLSDRTPRWVVVQLENSPSERPELLDAAYTDPFAAWLEPDAQGHMIVRIDAEILENSLFRGKDPVAGSFSDYVWVFDAHSGEVLSASFSGVFSYSIDWGFAKSEIHARVRAWMGTGLQAGFRDAESVWGRVLYPYCDDVEDPRCTAVPSASYDRDRGYVNAVGYLSIDSPLTQFATYSAMGEARFSELPEEAPREARLVSQANPDPGLEANSLAGPAP